MENRKTSAPTASSANVPRRQVPEYAKAFPQEQYKERKEKICNSQRLQARSASTVLQVPNVHSVPGSTPVSAWCLENVTGVNGIQAFAGYM